jgi:hypothetical protein
MTTSDAPQNYPGDNCNSQNQNKDPKSTGPKGNPYDSENLDQESDSDSKDITEKDTQKDLIENDPSKGFETDIDTPKSGQAESGTFETIAPGKDNPAQREFEIGELGNEELKEDELTRDASHHGAPSNNKPSQRKF